MTTPKLGISYILDLVRSKLIDESAPIEDADINAIVSTVDSFLSSSISHAYFEKTLNSMPKSSEILRLINSIIEIPPGSPPIQQPAANLPAPQHSGGRKPAQTWTQAEDSRLLAGILYFGIESWSTISDFVGNNRSRAQCSQRWHRGLRPFISKKKWDREEDDRLLNLVQTFGKSSWARIASSIGNRSDVQCRYRFRQILNMKARKKQVEFGMQRSKSTEGESLEEEDPSEEYETDESSSSKATIQKSSSSGGEKVLSSEGSLPSIKSDGFKVQNIIDVVPLQTFLDKFKTAEKK